MLNIFRRKQVVDKPEPTGVPAHALLTNAAIAFTAYKLENGYLVQLHSATNGMYSKVFYCEDEEAIARTVVAERAKDKMGVNQQGSAFRPAYTSSVGISTSNLVRSGGGGSSSDLIARNVS